jgi:origin recognition complex subunit 3
MVHRFNTIPNRSPFPFSLSTYLTIQLPFFFTVQLLNPSIRASIINGLLHPYDFTLPIPIDQNPNSPTDEDEDNADGTLSPTVSEIQARLESTHVQLTSSSPPKHDTHTPDKDMTPTTIHQLPDTSILFDRYMNGAGKLINVYDWYQSFKIVLESQRSEEEVKRRAEIEAQQKEKKSKSKGKTPGGRGSRRGKVKARGSPVKKGKGKEKARQQTDSSEEEEEEEKEEQMIDDEAYQQEIQARFIRSVHELDYLGFLKHTGRRKEHVFRTVFDVVDDEVEVEEVGGDHEDGFVSGDDDDDVDVDDGQEDDDIGEDGLGENGDEEDEE